MMTNDLRVSLCPNCDACPEVVVADDAVTIGEEGNQVRLTREEWNVLVAAIESGEIGSIGDAGSGNVPNSCC
jgi:hypothetical protein